MVAVAKFCGLLPSVGFAFAVVVRAFVVSLVLVGIGWLCLRLWRCELCAFRGRSFCLLWLWRLRVWCSVVVVGLVLVGVFALVLV